MRDIIKLKKAIEINGKEVKELPYDPDEIDCQMFNKASALSTGSNRTGTPNMSVMELDSAMHMYLGMMAVIAVNSEIDITDLERIKGSDLIKLVQIGRNFITRSSAEDSEPDNLEEQSEVTPESITPVSEK